jgi:hypothetical protein
MRDKELQQFRSFRAAANFKNTTSSKNHVNPFSSTNLQEIKIKFGIEKEPRQISSLDVDL